MKYRCFFPFFGFVLFFSSTLFARTPVSPTSEESAREEALFGEEAPESQPITPSSQPSPMTLPSTSSEKQLLEAPSEDETGTASPNAHDKLQIGGLLYMRMNWSVTDGSRSEDHPVSMPNLVDLFLDARPNDRLRAFVRGRLNWDPTIDENDPLIKASDGKQLRVELNEFWLKFDIARTLYLTIGQQKIRWGATRFWNPVDVVNQSLRALLNPFDARSGVPMIRLHFPLESLGWNFYLAGLLDKMNSIDKAGIVGRAEFVVSTVELGLVGAYRDGIDPKVGIDLSAGIWDFDVTSELGIRIDRDAPHDISTQLSAGIEYSLSVFDDDMLILGGEFFFNQRGHSYINPLDLFSGDLQLFYAGRHYAALFASLPKPAKLDDWTFTVSGIGNLSDKSFIARFDLSVKVLTFMTIQAFVATHFGDPGELRLGDDAFPKTIRASARALYNPNDPTQQIPTQLIDTGLWLSVDL